eukprot:3832632-Prymnesium_polylepis.1
MERELCDVSLSAPQAAARRLRSTRGQKRRRLGAPFGELGSPPAPPMAMHPCAEHVPLWA